jgi:hypothetical protein
MATATASSSAPLAPAATAQPSSSLEDRLNLLLNREDGGGEFSVVEYLNLALAGEGSDRSFDIASASSSSSSKHRQQQQQRLAELALQLQVQTSACHEEIGRVSAELQAILPRCGADLQRLGSGLEGLRQDATALLEAHHQQKKGEDQPRGGTVTAAGSAIAEAKAPKSSDDEIEADEAHAAASTTTIARTSTSSLETLSALHSLQSNLQRTREILVAASQWDATLQLIPRLLASAGIASSASSSATSQQQHHHHHSDSNQNLDGAVAALAQLEVYQKNLAGMPGGNEEREKQRKRLREQVMSLLAPVLQQALVTLAGSNGRVVQPIQHCAVLYGRLRALSVLQGEYIKHRPAALHRQWFDYDPRHHQSFPRWLPTWLDSVYQLLAEELRQSCTIFGSAAAAGSSGGGALAASATVPIAVALRVLRECFRPLKASWSGRLENLCSSSPPSSSSTGSASISAAAEVDLAAGNDHGDLEGLCASYESLLQFLSIAYSTIVGSYQDLVEAAGRPGGGDVVAAASDGDDSPGAAALTPRRLFGELSDAFVQVASPFAPFQERFGLLESRYSRARIVAQWEQQLQAVLRVASGVRNSDEDHDINDKVPALASSEHGRPKTPASSSLPTGNPSSSSAVTSDGLSRATDELLRLVPALFAGAEGSLDRYELLLGGYSVAESALHPVDDALSAQLRHLSSLISTLSRLAAAPREKMLSSPGSISSHGVAAVVQQHQHLDEDTVTASLQLLHVAGRVLECSRDFAKLARGRMSVWSDRLVAAASRQGGGSDAPSLVLLPESLSPIEVDSIVTQAVAVSVLGEDAATARSNLRQLLLNGTEEGGSEPLDPVSVLFPRAHQGVLDVRCACQVLVFEACSAVPLRHLAALPSMACWKEGTVPPSSALPGGEYGALPQSYMTHVGEHMLALVQALEPFASDPQSLALAKPAMVDARRVAVAPWQDLLQSTAGAGAGGDDGDDVVLQFMTGKRLAGLLASVGASGGGAPSDRQGKEDDRDDKGEHGTSTDVSYSTEEASGGGGSGSSTAFCNAWLDAVGCAVTGRLLERIMRIPSLSSRGCEHLSADLTYLSNVLLALDVAGHPHPLLQHVVHLATADGETISELISRRSRTDPLESALASIEERMAAIRGVAAHYNY